MSELKKVNSIFISDVHLGWKYSSAKKLAKFLSQYESNHLYILGDFFDFFGFPRNWVWNEGMFDVFGEIIRLKVNGCKVVYVVGNHDKEILQKGFIIPGVEIVSEAVHITNAYKPIFLTHGDLFDTVLEMKVSPFLYKLGDKFYYMAIWANQKINRVRKLFGLRYWSLSAHLKHNVKNAINYLSDFENVISEYCKNRGYNAIMVGHVHIPAIKTLPSGIEYYNSGAWIVGEGESALIESLDGKLHLYRREEQ